MTTPVAIQDRTPLELALADVYATLTDLLVAADDQYAAVTERDRDRIEDVTARQERLSARLASAESRRIHALNGQTLAEAVATEPRAQAISASIASSVKLLKARQSQTATLLEQSIDLTDQTIRFLHRLVAPDATVYGARGLAASRRSVLVDSRA
jgi:flagellar biosynthesis/type III secretory pathway chaperone